MKLQIIYSLHKNKNTTNYIHSKMITPYLIIYVRNNSLNIFWSKETIIIKMLVARFHPSLCKSKLFIE